jgi:hypothetical protein
MTLTTKIYCSRQYELYLSKLVKFLNHSFPNSYFFKLSAFII